MEILQESLEEVSAMYTIDIVRNLVSFRVRTKIPAELTLHGLRLEPYINIE